MYMIVTTMGLAFAVMLTVNHWLALPGLLAALTIGLYVDLPMVPLSIGLSVIWFIFWWQQGRNRRWFVIWFAAVLGSWLLYLPIMPYLTFTFNDLNRIYVFREFRDALGLPNFAPWHYLVGLAIIAMLLGLAAIIAQRWLRRSGFRRWFGPLAVFIFGLITMTTPIPRLFAIERVMLTGWPYVVLLIAWILVNDEKLKRYALIPLLVISLAASIGALLVPKDDWRGAVAFIHAKADPDDLVWIEPHWNKRAVEYYQLPNETKTGTVAMLQKVVTGDRDIWIIAERFPNLSAPSSASEAWLDDNLELIFIEPFYRLEVRHYKP